MKINIFHIVVRHIATLRNEASGKVAIADVLVFYIFPAVVSFLILYSDVDVNKSVYGFSVSVFSIFAALLLSVQIALFGIFQRGWKTDGDPRKDVQSQRKRAERNNLLRELNTNISYLTVICCTFISLLIIFYVFKINEKIEIFVFFYVFIHFVLTLFMVIKRSHALFQKEYEMT